MYYDMHTFFRISSLFSIGLFIPLRTLTYKNGQ